MTLKEYLKKNRISIRDLARAAKITPQYLSDIARGKLPYGSHVATRVQVATNGEVNIASMIDGSACTKLAPHQHLTFRPNKQDDERQAKREARAKKLLEEISFDL